MTINYTSLLKLAKPVTGTESGTWGDTVNDAITSPLDVAVAGAVSIDVTSGNVTLSNNDGSGSNQARYAILLVIGTPGVSRNIIGPGTSKIYLVKNSSNGDIVVKASATTGVTIPVNTEASVFWNGSDYEIVGMQGPSSSTDNAVVRFDGTTGKLVQNSVVTIADSTGDVAGVGALTMGGNLTLSGGTANGVLYLNGSKVATSGSALVFDGTNLGLGVTPSAWEAGRPAVQVGGTVSYFIGNSVVALGANHYFNGSNTYVGTGNATQYARSAGQHIWFTAPSGTAGNAITFTQAMTLDASGNLNLGMTGGGGRLNIGNSAGTNGQVDLYVRNLTSGTAMGLIKTGSSYSYAGVGANTSWLYSQGTDTLTLGPDGAAPITFVSNGSERARILSSGEFLVGRTSTIGSSFMCVQGGPIGWVGNSSGVDGTYIDWLVCASYSPNTTEQHRVRASISGTAGSSGIQFMISDGGGASTQTESFRINRTSCTVVGSLSKGSGSFKIDHPLKPDTPDPEYPLCPLYPLAPLGPKEANTCQVFPS